LCEGSRISAFMNRKPKTGDKMMLKISKLEILTEFGFTRDPFKQLRVKSSDHVRIGKVVSMAVKDRAMVSVIGERGIGKSCALRCALGNMKKIQAVFPYANDINKLLISDIEQALIFDLSSEKPKRGREIRARQLRHIIGEASNRMDVVLVIEEAHQLHGQTLRSLKRIREMEWMGESPLFSVILICQADPMNKPGVAEVRLRSDAVHMKGLSREEVAAFVNRAAGKVFDQEAIQEISKLPGSHNYEDLKEMLFQLMGNALIEGRRVVTLSDIDSVFGARNLEEMRLEAGMTKSALAKRSGYSQPTVSKVLQRDGNGKLTPSDKEKKDVLSSILQQHIEKDSDDLQRAAMGN